MLAHAVDASESSQPRQGVRGLVIATFAFVTVFAASAVPIPLYSEYKGAIGLTDADISATMLMYLFGVVLTLFLSGSLSDAAGRRPLAAASLLLAMLGCFLFLRAADPTIVLVARAVQGVSCGLAMSAVSALVVDSAVGRYEGFGLAVAGCGALLGVMAGSLAVGFLSLVTQQHALIYWIMIALLALGAILIPAAPETVVSRVPLRTASALGAPLEARMPSGVSLRVSMAALLVFTCAMCVAMAAGALGAFLVLVALFGLSTGMCLSGSLRLLFARADMRGTATVVSTINLVFARTR